MKTKKLSINEVRLHPKSKKSRSKKLVQWIEELQVSKKAVGQLAAASGKGLCCLGVYCHHVEGVDRKDMNKDFSATPADVNVTIDFLKGKEVIDINNKDYAESVEKFLIEANDGDSDVKKASHIEIANWLERNLLRKS